MAEAAAQPVRTRLLLFGFMAGSAATLVFHQAVVALLWKAGLAPAAPFPLAPTWPLGIPAVLSLAFWGGIWGILFALLSLRFHSHDSSYWLTAFLFGALFPSLVALLVVMPLKGRPLGGGWRPPLLITAFLANGAWGIGTALVLSGLERLGQRTATPR